jgi:heme oxygenase
MPSTPGLQNNLDLTLDVATLLRQGTAVAHEAAEHSEGAAWLTRGELDREEYVRFLIILWHVYTYVPFSHCTFF